MFEVFSLDLSNFFSNFEVSEVTVREKEWI